MLSVQTDAHQEETQGAVGWARHEGDDAPAGVRFAAGHTSAAEGLGDLIERVRPTVCLFGHHHENINVEVRGTEACIGLNLIGRAGNLVAFELTGDVFAWWGNDEVIKAISTAGLAHHAA